MGKWIVTALVIILVIAVAFVVAAAIYPTFREISRDIAIVVLAVFQVITAIVATALLVAFLYTVFYLRTLSRTTIIPQVEILTAKINQIAENTSTITGNAKTTATTVSSTTSYVAEQAVAPLIRLSGLFAGARAAASFLARRETPPGQR